MHGLIPHTLVHVWAGLHHPIWLLKIQNLRPPHSVEVMIITTALPAKGIFVCNLILQAFGRVWGIRELYFSHFQIPSISTQLEREASLPSLLMQRFSMCEST